MASYMGFDAAAWLEMDDPAVLLADFDMSPNLGRNLGPKANMVLPPSPMPSTTPTALPSDPMFTAPSREYSEYRQETPVVPGAFVNTMSHISEPWVPPTFDNDFSFATSPLDSPTSSAAPPLSKKRVYPGFHSMQHQQQLQQQQHLQLQQRTQQLQQRTQDMHLGTQAHYVQHFPAAVSPSVDEGAPAEPPRTNGSRTKKNEDEMDEDEKLLNSEAGKQLNSKARRQLRNKVSARHFRSRRKEQMQVTEERLRKSVEKGELMGTRILFLEGKVSSLEQENHRLASLVNGPMTGFMNSPEFQAYLRRTQSLFTFTPPQTQASQPDGLSMLAASPPNLQVNAPLVSFSGVDMDSLVNLDDFDDDVDDEVADELPKKRFKSL